LDWSNDLTGWLTHPLDDPLHQLIAAFHVYSWNRCAAPSCWDATVATVGAKVPIVTTEVGEKDCRGWFVTKYLNWAAPRGISALAWTWNDNEQCLSLLKGPASGTTAYGAAVRRAFRHLSVRADGAPTDTP
jgi:endoglucanase